MRSCVYPQCTLSLLKRFFFSPTDQTLWVKTPTPAPSLQLRPTPLSPQLHFLSPPSPLFLSLTLQVYPILSPLSLLWTIPPFSHPPRHSPPPRPLPYYSRRASPSPRPLLQTLPHHSHSCPHPPLPQTPITQFQRQSALTRRLTPLFLPQLPHVRPICRIKSPPMH